MKAVEKTSYFEPGFSGRVPNVKEMTETVSGSPSIERYRLTLLIESRRVQPGPIIEPYIMPRHAWSKSSARVLSQIILAGKNGYRMRLNNKTG
jgi:hypothetical protein